MDDSEFSLRWNNHQATIISSFKDLLKNEEFVDCTLAAEGKFIKAHKFVLSACSPYFANLLSQHYDKHPILILKDVTYQDLCGIMDYMYQGQVNVSRAELESLFKTAKSLQIKGICYDQIQAFDSINSLSEEEQSIDVKAESTQVSNLPKLKKKRPSMTAFEEFLNNAAQKGKKTKRRKTISKETNNNQKPTTSTKNLHCMDNIKIEQNESIDDYSEDAEKYNIKQEEEIIIESDYVKMASNSKPTEKRNRAKSSSACNSLESNYPKKIYEPKYFCNLCTRGYYLRRTLTRHIRHDCPNNPNRVEYVCDICNFASNRRYKLITHVKLKHSYQKQIIEL